MNFYYAARTPSHSRSTHALTHTHAHIHTHTHTHTQTYIHTHARSLAQKLLYIRLQNLPICDQRDVISTSLASNFLNLKIIVIIVIGPFIFKPNHVNDL